MKLLKPLSGTSFNKTLNPPIVGKVFGFSVEGSCKFKGCEKYLWDYFITQLWCRESVLYFL